MRIFSTATVFVLFAAIICLPNLSSAKDFGSVPGEYLVKLRKDVPLRGPRELSELLHSKVKRVISEDRIAVIERSVLEMPKSVVQTLSRNPAVEIVEPNYIYRAEKMPNDPDFSKLWGLSNLGQNDGKTNGVPGVDIDAMRAWDITTGSDQMVVAVIDTGIDYNHPDLQQNVWTNEAEAQGQAGIDDDANGVIDDIHGASFVNADMPSGNPLDDHGHGSHCSGTIGGYGDDGKGIVGVNWRVKIMPVKFLAADGGGSLEGAIKAIDYATRMGVKIMSNSWGGGSESQLLKEAIERANEAGALFIAAAGNDSENNDSSPHYPSGYSVPNILSVAAVDNRGELAAFSNFGKRSVHVAAPGVNIFSSLNNGQYDSWSGTSMATPHVSGVAALLASKEPALTNLELKKRIISTVKPLAGVRGKVASGGLVNAYFALTNEVAPPDMDDPAHWESKPVTFSTAHPYDKKENLAYEVKVDGAKQIALYFEKFDTENTYDKLTLIDKNGDVVAVLSGMMDESFSPIIEGDSVQLVFTSDDTVQKYGFDLARVSFR